jgi:hypothetical protein
MKKFEEVDWIATIILNTKIIGTIVLVIIDKPLWMVLEYGLW